MKTFIGVTLIIIMSTWKLAAFEQRDVSDIVFFGNKCINVYSDLIKPVKEDIYPEIKIRQKEFEAGYNVPKLITDCMTELSQDPESKELFEMDVNKLKDALTDYDKKFFEDGNKEDLFLAYKNDSRKKYCDIQDIDCAGTLKEYKYLYNRETNKVYVPKLTCEAHGTKYIYKFERKREEHNLPVQNCEASPDRFVYEKLRTTRQIEVEVYDDPYNRDYYMTETVEMLISCDYDPADYPGAILVSTNPGAEDDPNGWVTTSIYKRNMFMSCDHDEFPKYPVGTLTKETPLWVKKDGVEGTKIGDGRGWVQEQEAWVMLHFSCKEKRKNEFEFDKLTSVPEGKSLLKGWDEINGYTKCKDEEAKIKADGDVKVFK